MASVASQIILHPLVSQSLKFGSTTLGRDKAYRAVQYFARFFSWHLLNKGDKLDAARWNALKSHLGTARKLLRLGKPIEHLQAALRASFASGPAVEQILTIGRQLGYFGYLSYDALVWTARLASESKKLEARTSYGEIDISAENQREARLSSVKAAQTATRNQLIIDILDVWIPATGAGVANLNEGTLGIFGLITSILGIQAQWRTVNGK
ncbi:hypothetical protein DXG01_000115 [Tephrocybe rancida]|nr:hypothetical protein DXG01_000115 [Tephrocybe rancida]